MWAPKQGREMFKNDFFEIVFSLPASSAIGYTSADSTLWFSSAVVSVRGCWQIYAGMSDGSIYIVRKTVEFDQNEDPTVKSLKLHERWDDIHDLRVSYLAMANSGSLLVSLSLDLMCKVMDPANGQTIFSMKNCRKCMYTGIVAMPSSTQSSSTFYVVDESGYADVFDLFYERKTHSIPVVPNYDERKAKAMRRSHNGKSMALLKKFGSLPGYFLSIVPRQGETVSKQLKQNGQGCSILSGDLMIWRVEQVADCREFLGHVGAVQAIALPPPIEDSASLPKTPTPTPNRGHSSCNLQVSKEESVMFSAGQDDCTLRCWDEYDGKESYQIKTSQRAVSSLSSDTSSSASHTITSMLCLWKFSKIVVGHSDGAVHLYSSDSGSVVSSSVLKESVTGITDAISQKSSLLIACDESGCMAIWNLTMHFSNPAKFPLESVGRGFHAPQSPGMAALSFHHESHTLFSGGEDCVLKYWKIHDSGAATLDMGHSDPVCSIRCSENFLLAGDEGGKVCLARIIQATAPSALPNERIVIYALRLINSWASSVDSRSMADLIELDAGSLYVAQAVGHAKGLAAVWKVSCRARSEQEMKQLHASDNVAAQLQDTTCSHRDGDENSRLSTTMVCTTHHSADPTMVVTASLVRPLGRDHIEISCCQMSSLRNSDGSLVSLYLGTTTGAIYKYSFHSC